MGNAILCWGSASCALLTLVERKTRCSLIPKLPTKGSASVMEAFRVIRDELFAGCFDKVFRTLTTDNGSEFARLPELEGGSTLRFCYARPYCSGDKGTNEDHNGLFRRFLPKGKCMRDYPADHISACPAMGKHLATKDSRISKPRSVLPRRASAKIGFLIGLLGVQVIIAIRVMRLRNYPSFMPTYFMPLPGKGD